MYVKILLISNKNWCYLLVFLPKFVFDQKQIYENVGLKKYWWTDKIAALNSTAQGPLYTCLVFIHLGHTKYTSNKSAITGLSILEWDTHSLWRCWFWSIPHMVSTITSCSTKVIIRCLHGFYSCPTISGILIDELIL